jgi:uncharacterized protein YjiS (DUF1127 family)
MLMHDRTNRLLLTLMLALAGTSALRAQVSFESLAQRPPGEQYRQLSLLSLVASGAEPALVALLAPYEAQQAAPGSMELQLDDYVGPLARIVDQEILLAGAAQMFRFARANSAEIQARMTQIAREHPILISMVDVNEIAADAIIIRNSIADSLEYSLKDGAAGAAQPEHDMAQDPAQDPAQDVAPVQAFREQTVHLRNMMEYNQFEAELAQITEEAIVDLGGRLDAYQRMFDDEIDPELISRRVESAEIMNRQTGNRFEEQAMQHNAELLMMLILMESQAY